MEDTSFHEQNPGYLVQKETPAQQAGQPQLSEAELCVPLTMITETPVVVLFCLGSALLKCCFSLPVTSACILFSWDASSYGKEPNTVTLGPQLQRLIKSPPCPPST